MRAPSGEEATESTTRLPLEGIEELARCGVPQFHCAGGASGIDEYGRRPEKIRTSSVHFRVQIRGAEYLSGCRVPELQSIGACRQDTSAVV